MGDSISELYNSLKSNSKNSLEEKVDGLYKVCEKIMGVVLKIVDETHVSLNTLYTRVENLEGTLSRLEYQANDLETKINNYNKPKENQEKLSIPPPPPKTEIKKPKINYDKPSPMDVMRELKEKLAQRNGQSNQGPAKPNPIVEEKKETINRPTLRREIMDQIKDLGEKQKKEKNQQ